MTTTPKKSISKLRNDIIFPKFSTSFNDDKFGKNSTMMKTLRIDENKPVLMPRILGTPFPTVSYIKPQLKRLKPSIRKLVSVRIPPPDDVFSFSITKSNEKKTVGATNDNDLTENKPFEYLSIADSNERTNDESSNTRSVLDALRDISKKRLLSKEEINDNEHCKKAKINEENLPDVLNEDNCDKIGTYNALIASLSSSIDLRQDFKRKRDDLKMDQSNLEIDFYENKKRTKLCLEQQPAENVPPTRATSNQCDDNQQKLIVINKSSETSKQINQEEKIEEPEGCIINENGHCRFTFIKTEKASPFPLSYHSEETKRKRLYDLLKVLNGGKDVVLIDDQPSGMDETDKGENCQKKVTETSKSNQNEATNGSTTTDLTKTTIVVSSTITPISFANVTPVIQESSFAIGNKRLGGSLENSKAELNQESKNVLNKESNELNRGSISTNKETRDEFNKESILVNKESSNFLNKELNLFKESISSNNESIADNESRSEDASTSANIFLKPSLTFDKLFAEKQQSDDKPKTVGGFKFDLPSPSIGVATLPTTSLPHALSTTTVSSPSSSSSATSLFASHFQKSNNKSTEDETTKVNETIIVDDNKSKQSSFIFGSNKTNENQSKQLTSTENATTLNLFSDNKSVVATPPPAFQFGSSNTQATINQQPFGNNPTKFVFGQTSDDNKSENGNKLPGVFSGEKKEFQFGAAIDKKSSSIFGSADNSNKQTNLCESTNQSKGNLFNQDNKNSFMFDTNADENKSPPKSTFQFSSTQNSSPFFKSQANASFSSANNLFSTNQKNSTNQTTPFSSTNQAPSFSTNQNLSTFPANNTPSTFSINQPAKFSNNQNQSTFTNQSTLFPANQNLPSTFSTNQNQPSTFSTNQNSFLNNQNSPFSNSSASSFSTNQISSPFQSNQLSSSLFPSPSVQNQQTSSTFNQTSTFASSQSGTNQNLFQFGSNDNKPNGSDSKGFVFGTTNQNSSNQISQSPGNLFSFSGNSSSGLVNNASQPFSFNAPAQSTMFSIGSGSNGPRPRSTASRTSRRPK